MASYLFLNEQYMELLVDFPVLLERKFQLLLAIISEKLNNLQFLTHTELPASFSFIISEMLMSR